MAKVYPRYMETLVWESGHDKYVFDFTWGVSHIYFPTLEKWLETHPSLTERRYKTVLRDVKAWAKRERVPLTIQPQASVTVETA